MIFGVHKGTVSMGFRERRDLWQRHDKMWTWQVVKLVNDTFENIFLYSPSICPSAVMNPVQVPLSKTLILNCKSLRVTVTAKCCRCKW